MRSLSIVTLVAFLACGSAAAADADAVASPSAATAASTVSGIALDAPWKVKLYAFVRARFHHPAWGWQHSERDYRLALGFAKDDGIAIDPDVLFAAAMLHDMAAFPPYEKKNVEHGDVAADASGPVLREMGFPMEKLPGVQAAERGHMFYSVATAPEAIVLHDADSVDFLGAMGATRMLALTGASASDVGAAIASLASFADTIPGKLLTKSARAMGAQRASELKAYLARLDAESYGGLR